MNKVMFASLAKQCKSNPLLNDLLGVSADVYLVEAIIDVGVCKISISAKNKNIKYEFEPSEVQPFVRHLWTHGNLHPQVNEFRSRLLQIHSDTLDKLMI